MINSATLEKRTSESIQYDINCSFLLDSGETVTGIPVISADQSGLVLGAATVNAAIINYDDGTSAAIGKVIQVRISGGLIPFGQTSQLYTIRAVFTTSSSNTREATVLLNVTNLVK